MSKKEVISFKADKDLARFIKSLPNSSDFIRDAIMSARMHSCPVCKGKGFMNSDEMVHLKSFLKTHNIKDCKKCKSTIIECEV